MSEQEFKERTNLIFWFCIFIGGVAWIVSLSGTASSQANCDLNKTQAVPLLNFPTCSSVFGLPWWILCYQLFLLVIVVFLRWKDEAMMGAKLPIVTNLGVLVSLQTVLANVFLQADSQAGSSEARAAAAGAIMLTMVDMVLIFVIGTADEGVVLGPQFNPDFHNETTYGDIVESQKHHHRRNELQ